MTGCNIVWLLKPAELSLKGDNKKSFENALKQNLVRMLKEQNSEGNIKTKFTEGRYFIEAPEEKSSFIEDVLSRLTGISGWARPAVCKKTIEDICAACVREARALASRGIKTFKINARRTDKSFPFNSYEICCKAGEDVTQEVNEMRVNVSCPEETINVEIREKAYVYSGGKKGLGGLPAGTAGKALLLLSGGIDSPVAAFLMAKRGMKIEAVHFHSYPYTSNEAKEKVISLSKKTGSYTMGIKLYIVNFREVQMRIKEKAPHKWTTVLLRMAMMEAAEKIALKTKAKALITGESLSQVASQTIENLHCSQSRIKLPVLRPLIGLDKESIISEAQKTGTFEISIRPFEDCCTLFTPMHPILHGDVSEANAHYESLELEPLIDEALKNYELITE